MYVRSRDDFDMRARMFAPLDGVPEDPATGSANCALAAMLAREDARPGRDVSLAHRPGRRDGPPSVLEARAEKKGGAVVSATIRGASVLVAEGWIEVP